MGGETVTADELERAACRGKPQTWWYPVDPFSAKAYSLTRADWRREGARALAICATCPVVDACKREAIRTHDWHGIRAGMIPPDLHKLTGDRRKHLRVVA